MRFYRYLLIVAVVVLALIGLVFLVRPVFQATGGATFGQRTSSSTTFSLTTSSQRLLATSTSRVAASFSVVNCATTNDAAFLNFGSDVAATVANSDYAIFASSTDTLSPETGNTPPFESVTGITQGGACTVKVTEWRNR